MLPLVPKTLPFLNSTSSVTTLLFSAASSYTLVFGGLDKVGLLHALLSNFKHQRISALAGAFILGFSSSLLPELHCYHSQIVRQVSLGVAFVLMGDICNIVDTDSRDSCHCNHLFLLIIETTVGIRIFDPALVRSGAFQHFFWFYSHQLCT